MVFGKFFGRRPEQAGLSERDKAMTRVPANEDKDQTQEDQDQNDEWGNALRAKVSELGGSYDPVRAGVYPVYVRPDKEGELRAFLKDQGYEVDEAIGVMPGTNQAYIDRPNKKETQFRVGERAEQPPERMAS